MADRTKIVRFGPFNSETVWKNGNLLSHYIEDKRPQMAFCCIFIPFIFQFNIQIFCQSPSQCTSVVLVVVVVVVVIVEPFQLFFRLLIA